MEKTFPNIGLEQLEEVKQWMLEKGKALPVWTFTGDLGAGKTTLIQALAKELGIQDEVSSPTYNYVNEYDGQVFHFDCYRLDTLEQALNLGLEEYIDSGKKCWIEWPEVISSLLPVPSLHLHIAHNPDQTRTYHLSIY
jgi:tRNA threonylcarbamoyladenosine biosynthesis protein TsaE